MNEYVPLQEALARLVRWPAQLTDADLALLRHVRPDLAESAARTRATAAAVLTTPTRTSRRRTTP